VDKNSLPLFDAFKIHTSMHMYTPNRYIRNEQMLSPEENRSLRDFRVAVVGCGGLGGYLIEMLARLGIGHLTVIDGDVFEESNLNRQLLSNMANLGRPKAYVAKEHIGQVNPEIQVDARHVLLTSENAVSLLTGHDLVCDALDEVLSRKVLQSASEKLGIPLVYAAIAGWYAHVATIMPGDRLLDILYPDDNNKGMETQLGNPSFTPALAASLQVAETLKVLLKKDGILRNRVLVVNTLDHLFDIIDLS
jgi:molybdopterin-synthase adenylyltransferase